MITRQGILNEVWQKWCDLDNEDFDAWLHSEMINEGSQKEVKNINEETETKPLRKRDWRSDGSELPPFVGS